MAAGATTTGLREMQAAVRRLPEAVVTAARNVARRTAVRVAAGARLRVAVRSGEMKASIKVLPETKEKQYIVRAGELDGPPIALFLEHGTIHMSARPFMGPALEAERGNYLRDMERETAEAAREVMG